VSSPDLYYLYCVGVSSSYCGGIASLQLTAIQQNTSIQVQDIYYADGVPCYWNITSLHENYESSAKILVYMNSISNINVTFVIGDTLETASLSFYPDEGVAYEFSASK